MASDNDPLPISVIGGHQVGINTAFIRLNAQTLSGVVDKVLQVRRIADQALSAAATLPRISVTEKLISALQMIMESVKDISLQLGFLQNNLLMAASKYENCEARSRQIFSSLDALPGFLVAGNLPGLLFWKEIDYLQGDSFLWMDKSMRSSDNVFLGFLQKKVEDIKGLPIQFLSAQAAKQIELVRGPSVLSIGRKLEGGPQKVSAPLNISGLVNQFNQAKSSPDHGELRVVQYRTGNQTAWRVDIRGTQVWSFWGSNPQDMRTNLQTNASGQAGNSDMTRAVIRALDQAGYRPGQPVELIGHSQGGAVAAQVGSNPYLAKKYNVKSVVTMGSNIGNFRPAPGVHMVSLENTADIVPRLDGRQNPNVPNLTTVQTHQNYQSVGANHSKELYERVAKAWEQSKDGDYARFIETRNYNLGINESTKATAQSFIVQRLDTPRPARSKTFAGLAPLF